MKFIWLIDGDMVAFRCAASAENDPEEIAIIRMDKMIKDQLLPSPDEGELKMFISSQENFRKKIYPEYKANRKQPTPVHLGACKEYLVKNFGAQIAHGCEADDYLATNQTKDSWIISNDKDMLQVPGNHYNPIKDQINQISEIEGLRHFYTQLLVGDAADNIHGVAGIGKVKAQRALEGYENEQDMFDKVRGMYNDDERLLVNGKLLWLIRQEGKLWEFPQAYSTPDLEQKSKYMNEIALTYMGLGMTDLSESGFPTDGLAPGEYLTEKTTQ